MISSSRFSANASRLTIVAFTLLAFALRIWRLDVVPPGWRDDELINSLVISQKVVDGDWAVYYPDASGHEALYHALNAVPLALFGPGVWGIRLLSVFLGTLTVPLMYVMGRRLLGAPAGIMAAAALAFSFWSLMYSRIGLRHILLPFLATAAFYFFWRGLAPAAENRKSVNYRAYLLAALFVGLGYYTYFAARGVPLILLAFCAYLWLFARDLFRKHWRGFALLFGVSSMMALPLLIALARQPESEARVAELALPLIEASKANFAPLWEHTRITLSMFHSDGDPEWLYNIPNRPVFGPLTALLFWTGVMMAAWYVGRQAGQALPLLSSRRKGKETKKTDPLALSSVFLLFWWLAGISPGFISVPPASLGHTILAQPAVYLLLALPLQRLSSWTSSLGRGRRLVFLTLALFLALTIAWRDLPDYFSKWPERGMVRFLYRGDIHAVADYLNERPQLQEFGVTGLLAGPWDKLALEIDLDETRRESSRPRWYDPRRAVLLKPSLSFAGFPDIPAVFAGYYEAMPEVGRMGAYGLSRVQGETAGREETCFANGLCLLSAEYDRESRRLLLTWRVKRRLDLPPMPLVSNPPPPGVSSSPRLLVFAQLHDANGRFLAGDDGLGVDPSTLHTGDVFLEQHRPVAPDGSRPAAVIFGLYDPLTGERILTEDGRDHLRLEIGE